MASRRSRIKGIANIPQRRKPENEKSKEESDQLSADAKCEENDTKITTSKNETIQKVPEDKQSPSPLEKRLDSNKSLVTIVSATISEDVQTVEENVVSEELPVVKQIPASNKPMFKRKFLKTPVSLNAIYKRKKTEEVKVEKAVPEKGQETDDNSEIPNKQIDNNVIVSEISTITESEVRSDDVSTGVIASLSEDIKNVFQKPASLVNNTTHSDTEYPLPPPSPNKANRSRIKAIPRLAHRKTSFSASESEDESRKINRNRNDSICSTTSAVAESITECFSPQRPKETITVSQPKKSAIRLEQTRKLAEARREFVRRFGFKKPERHRLTMMDLIFYNPDTNPMVNEDDTKENDTVNDADDLVNNEENIDDPNNTNDKKSEEENEILVPQIKIGPSGEIILDEQSLVIERKEVQRKREEMEKSKVVNLDKMKTGYGIYKKHKRTKLWSASETLYFYKALNTIGTDFTLMCDLFPNRTRRELKIKFKKEEKINRNLIDKALMEPCNFDYDDLKNEIELQERELEAIRKHEEEEKKLKEEMAKENQRIAMEKIQKRKAEENDNKIYIPKPKSIPRAPDLETSKPAVSKQKVKVPSKEKAIKETKPKPPKRSKKQKLSIQTYMSDSDADESDIATQSESDDDVVLSNKPTRSGRVPKATQRYDNEFSSIASFMKRNKIPDKDRPDNIEPGSIMVITETGPNGEPIYKLYMVTPEQEATPLDVPSDVAEAIQLKKGMTAKNIMTISANVTDDEEMLPENNITISADENITSLREETNITIPEDENVTTLRSQANNEKNRKNAENANADKNEEETNKTVTGDENKTRNNISDDLNSEDERLDEGNVRINEEIMFVDTEDEETNKGVPAGEYNEENDIFDDHIEENNEKNKVTMPESVDENITCQTVENEKSDNTIKVISIEPLEHCRDLSSDDIKENYHKDITENVEVLASDSDTVLLNRDNIVFVDNEDGDVSMDNSEIVLEVKSDGICVKLENESGSLRTGENDNSEVCKFTS